jgi:CDP-2,3-bis-(O-geranylgeranyl)-sn-glycerol synthase
VHNEDSGMAFGMHLLPGLLLLIVANATPVVAAMSLRGRLAAPLDFGVTLRDGTRLLGDHKTWRGVTVGVVACAIAAYLLGLTFTVGVAFGVLSLLADTAASFVKRRLRLVAGKEVPGLDQVPEAMLPLVALSTPLGISLPDCLLITVVFLVLDIAFVRFRHR